ncbi:hypothetical protein KCU81_g9735, partial [Aureobasidium melanogenum]
LLQTQSRQHPQTGTGTTSGAQAPNSPTAQSTSNTQTQNQSSSTAPTSQARDQTAPGALPSDQTASSSQSRGQGTSTFQAGQSLGTSGLQDPTPPRGRFSFDPANSRAAPNPFDSSTEDLSRHSVGDKRPVSPAAEQGEAQKMARTIGSTLEEGSRQRNNTRGVTDPEPSTTRTPPAQTTNRNYIEINVSTKERVKDSCLDQVFKNLAEGTWRSPEDMDDPDLDVNSWLGKIKACHTRDVKQKLAASGEGYNEESYRSAPRCYVGEMQKKPCVSLDGDKWTWSQHDANLTCPACETANPEFDSHQCLKVKDQNTFWLLNPTPDNINTQRACDDKHNAGRRGDAAPGASRSARPGPGPGPGPGGPTAGGPGDSSTTRRGGRHRGFSNVSAISTRTTRSRTSRGGTAETHDDVQPQTSPSKSKLSFRKFLPQKKPKETKSAAETEARFQDMFAVRPAEQDGSRLPRLPYRPVTLPTSHSVNFNAQSREPSKSHQLQRSKSTNLLSRLNPLNWGSNVAGADVTSESRVELLASEQNGGHENEHTNGHANREANGHSNGHHDDHLNGHNGTAENDTYETDPLGAGLIPSTRTVPHRYTTL